MPPSNRSTVAGGTEYMCVARFTSVPSAVNVCAASDTPTHFVGCISQPNSRRMPTSRWAHETAPWAVAWANIRSSKYARSSTPEARKKRAE